MEDNIHIFHFKEVLFFSGIGSTDCYQMGKTTSSRTPERRAGPWGERPSLLEVDHEAIPSAHPAPPPSQSVGVSQQWRFEVSVGGERGGMRTGAVLYHMGEILDVPGRNLQEGRQG